MSVTHQWNLNKTEKIKMIPIALDSKSTSLKMYVYKIVPGGEYQS